MAFRDKNTLISRSIKSRNGDITYNVNHYHVNVYKDYTEYLMCKVVSFIIIFSIIIISILIAIFNYESIYINDPLSIMKSNFFDIKFLGIVICVVLTILSFAKLKTRSAFKVIIASLICLLISVLISGYMMITLNSRYDESTLAEMYSENYFKEDIKGNINGDKLGVFIKETQKLNEKFQSKIVIICIMEYMMIFVNFFLLFSEMKMKKKYDRAIQENEVLFDEEQNVKI